MSARQLKLQLDNNQRRVLTNAIQVYCDAAYPPGGSECAQAAREALLNILPQLQNLSPGDETVTISRRMRSHLKAAVNYYCEQQHLPELQTTLLALLG